MMIPQKTAKEIEIMREGGNRLARVLDQVLKKAKPGMSLKRLDQLAESLIEKKQGLPSFKMVNGYNWPTCININQGVVHGIPGNYRLKDGDVVSVDIGMFYKGLHTDMARTIEVQSAKFKPSSRAQVEGVQSDKFLEAGEKALKKAIKAVEPENRIGHISEAIEKEIKKAGFNPVEALTGHGVGRKLHEEPQIPCFLKGKIEGTPKLLPGMTLAIEVIYTQGKPDVVLAGDGWTVRTADGKLAGLFEDTVVVTAKGAEVLTRAN